MRIESLQKYQRSHRRARFDDLPPAQRAQAEAHYERLCARWGDDLPLWRRAILVGRAKDLVLRPRTGAWARALRRGQHTSRSVAPPSPVHAAQAPLQPSVATGVVAKTPDPPIPSVPLKPASTPTDISPSPPAPSPFRLDVTGLSLSGTNGYESAKRILRDLESQAFWRSGRFTIGVRGRDLPRRWAWHLEVTPVP